MLKKLKLNKDVIAIGIAILLAIVMYGKYIATPFGDYDTWFERIAYGGYDFKQLPEPLQKLDIPVTLKQYAEYREKVVGRLFGSVLPTYAIASLFGDRVLGWRIFLYLVMFISFWLLYAILKMLSMTFWHRVTCLLFLVLLLNRYFFKPISIIIGLSHFFFILAVWLELKNSGLREFRLRYSLAGALFVFLSLFIRELSATSVPAFMAILFFWHCERNGAEIMFKWRWGRLLPYALAGTIFAGLYLRMSLLKAGYAYSNLVSWRIDGAYFKGMVLLLLRWIGLDSSLYLGLFLSLLAGMFFLLALVGGRNFPEKTEVFFLVFGFLLLAPTLLLIPFLQHGTGSFTLQFLAVMIILSFFFGSLERSSLRRPLKRAGQAFLFLVFSALWVVYALEAKQKAENFCADARVTDAAVRWTARRVPQSGMVELAGFSVTSAYSFVADIFMAGRTDPLGYRLQAAAAELDNENYMKYLRGGFSGGVAQGRKADVIVRKCMLTLNAPGGDYPDRDGAQVFEHPIKRYSLGYALASMNAGRTGAGERVGYTGWETFISKFFFGVRPQTLEKQLLTGIAYSIDRREAGEDLRP